MKDQTSEPPPQAPLAEAFGQDRENLGPYGCWPYVDRRSGVDRREAGTKVLSTYSLRGSRAAGRRAGERHNFYVDRYHTRDMAMATAILVLNILDAWFTLVYLGKGGTEANPIAQYLMDQGWFIFSKAIVVGFCVLFLTVHKTFRFVRPALFVLLAFYTGLLLYHIYLHWSLSRWSA
jgi:hypothetical protein